MKKITFLFLVITQVVSAQTNLVVDIINEIEFKEDTIKSVFEWVTDNIKYDVAKLHEIEKGGNSKKKSNFRSEIEYNNSLLIKVIKQRKGVCQDYSLLFDAMVKELGFESYIINGFTKNKQGKLNLRTGHSWNAVKVNDNWKLYDPTWGAGYLNDNEKFVKKYNSDWYDVNPDKMIIDHMPFDPIWQLSDNPINYANFKNNKGVDNEVASFNYKELIQIYRDKGKKEQMEDQVLRSKELGDGIRLVENWRRNLIKNISVYGITSNYELIKNAQENSNKAVQLFNEYIAAKNKQFKGKKWAIEKAKENLHKSKETIQSAYDIFKSIEVEDKKLRSNVDKSIKNSEKLLNRITEEYNYLK